MGEQGNQQPCHHSQPSRNASSSFKSGTLARGHPTTRSSRRMDCTSRPPSAMSTPTGLACSTSRANPNGTHGRPEKERAQKMLRLLTSKQSLHNSRSMVHRGAHQTECRMMPQHFERSSANEVTQHTRTGHLLPTVELRIAFPQYFHFNHFNT